MQARIKKDQLTVFKLQASRIKTNMLLPILTYIKIEVKGDECTLIKNNLESFIIRRFQNDSEDCSFLVVENILFNFIEFSDSEFIEFETSTNRIRISDSVSFMESPTERAVDFPMVDLSTTTWMPISKLALEAAGIAAKLIFTSEIDGPKSNVFIGRSHVAGTDGAIGYCQETKDNTPDICIRRTVAETVTGLASCEYSCNKSYDYFKDTETTFGFSRLETPFFDLVPLFGLIDNNTEKAFHTQKSLLIKFCTLCINSIDSKKEMSSALLRTENGKLVLTMEGSSIKTEYNIPVTGISEQFKFSPERMRTLLESLPCETVYFYPGDKRYLVSDETRSFVSVIMSII